MATSTSAPFPRRHLLRVLVAAGASLALAACGGSASVTGAATSSATGTQSAARTTAGVASTTTSAAASAATTAASRAASTATAATQTASTTVSASAPPAASGNTIQFWYSGVSQTAIEAYAAMGRDFAKAEPRITVKLSLVEGFPDKLIAAFAGNAGPDTFRIQPIDSLTLMPKGIYEPLDADISREHYDLKALWPGLAEQYIWQGKQLALPDTLNTTVLNYNVDLFKQAGLKTPNELADAKQWTWDACLKAAQHLTQADRFGFWTLDYPQSLLAWIWMNGGHMFDNADNPTKLTMAQPETVAALQWVGDLRSRYKVAPTPQQLVQRNSGATGNKLFYDGGLAMLTQLYNVDGVVKGVNGHFNWDVAPLPSGTQGLFDYVGGSTVGISTQSKLKDVAASWIFFVVGPDGQKENVSRQLGMPVVRSLVTSPEWKNASGAPPHQDSVVGLLDHLREIPKTVFWRPLATASFNPNITKLVSGELSAQAACAAMDEAGNAVLAGQKTSGT